MGGPLPFDTRSAFRCAFFSSFSRRLFARASSLRRFWNLVFDRLAKTLPSRSSKFAGHAQAARAVRRAPPHREYYDRLSQSITRQHFGPRRGMCRVWRGAVSASLHVILDCLGAALARCGRFRAESESEGCDSMRVDRRIGVVPSRLVAPGAARMPLRADFLQLRFLALGLADAKRSAAKIFRGVRAFFACHRVRACALRIAQGA